MPNFSELLERDRLASDVGTNILPNVVRRFRRYSEGSGIRSSILNEAKPAKSIGTPVATAPHLSNDATQPQAEWRKATLRPPPSPPESPGRIGDWIGQCRQAGGHAALR